MCICTKRTSHVCCKTITTLQDNSLLPLIKFIPERIIANGERLLQVWFYLCTLSASVKATNINVEEIVMQIVIFTSAMNLTLRSNISVLLVGVYC